LVSIVAARLFLPSAHPLFRPDLSAAILSIPFALFMLSDAARRRRSKAPPLRPRAIVARHSCAIALGAAVAAMSVGYARSAPSEDPLAHSRSERAAEWLWAQSALFGWGRGPMERLTGVLTEPAPAPTPLWGGWRRSLAAHGLTAALAGALLSLFLLRRALAARESERAAAAQWALPAAQAALALLFLGRPDSSVPALVAAGWIGLGLGGVASGVAPPRPATSARHAADITIWSASSFGALALLTAAALAAAAPTWSASIVASVRPQDLTDPALARRLEWARTLNPRNPEVERMEALRLRQRIDASRWDEALFDRARDAYRRAIALDPHEPALALNLADIEREAGREEDALATVYRSRSLNPRSMELIEWLYIFGAARGRSDLTERAVARGLQVEPDSPLWWRRRLALEVRASEIQSDSVARAESLALSAAIGGAPGEAAPIIRAAFARRR
jgi:tetratricopeptide (TPR) repeat protein